ncbi:hypothetical protein [Nonomuraea dietziae]|uniref:ATP-dependent DNA ligase n=1 Tax=Nonomuraea dietziae TaxID=65515 RepID=UPI0031D60E6B
MFGPQTGLLLRPSTVRDMAHLPAYQPMIAQAGAVPSGSDRDRWAVEMKWDGIRALLYVEDGRMRIHSRNGADVTAAYPELQMLAGARSADTTWCWIARSSPSMRHHRRCPPCRPRGPRRDLRVPPNGPPCLTPKRCRNDQRIPLGRAGTPSRSSRPRTVHDHRPEGQRVGVAQLGADRLA